MADFLLELYSEEIPANLQQWAAQKLADDFAKSLNEQGVSFADIKQFASPSRIAIIIKNLPEKIEPKAIDVKGPGVDAPEQAVNGFLKSNGLSGIDDLVIDEIKGRKFYFYRSVASAVLVEEFLKTATQEILQKFVWANSMRWADHAIQWVRPLKSIIALLNDKIVDVQFGHLSASNITRGHRFMASEILIKHADEYEAKLEEAKVIPDFAKRRDIILSGLKESQTELQIEFVKDDALLDEVTGLVDWPIVMAGEFDEKFLDLPREALVSVMRGHQKYFTCEVAGKITNKFLFAANVETKDAGKKIVQGNERVLRARLEDGAFFFAQDKKKSLAEFAKKLDAVTFYEDITVAAKQQKILQIALELNKVLGAGLDAQIEEASPILKADLASSMVDEFAELQGVAGYYYALHEGKGEDVAAAIAEHYLPRGLKDNAPIKPLSYIFAFADKMFELREMFARGQAPTGSKDPYALRRSAIGIIKIILENNLRFDLSEFFGGDENLQKFFHERFKVILKDKGFAHETISMALSESDFDFALILKKVTALDAFLKTPDGQDFLSAYNRAANILQIEEEKDKAKYDAHPDEALFDNPQEKDLSKQIDADLPKIEAALSEEDFEEVIKIFAGLKPSVDAFFENVIVNVNEDKIRKNRLALLNRIVLVASSVAKI